MKKNRKLFAILLTFALVLSLAACGSSGGSAASTTTDSSASGKADAAGNATGAPAEESSQDSAAVFRTLEEIQASGTINIGVFSDKNPFGYVDENGEYQGYDVYFANRIGEDLGVKINFVSTEAANRVEYLET